MRTHAIINDLVCVKQAQAPPLAVNQSRNRIEQCVLVPPQFFLGGLLLLIKASVEA